MAHAECKFTCYYIRIYALFGIFARNAFPYMSWVVKRNGYVVDAYYAQRDI
jgi:hypothetical protein